MDVKVLQIRTRLFAFLFFLHILVLYATISTIIFKMQTYAKENFNIQKL